MCWETFPLKPSRRKYMLIDLAYRTFDSTKRILFSQKTFRRAILEWLHTNLKLFVVYVCVICLVRNKMAKPFEFICKPPSWFLFVIRGAKKANRQGGSNFPAKSHIVKMYTNLTMCEEINAAQGNSRWMGNHMHIDRYFVFFYISPSLRLMLVIPLATKAKFFFLSCLTGWQSYIPLSLRYATLGMSHAGKITNKTVA